MALVLLDLDQTLGDFILGATVYEQFLPYINQNSQNAKQIFIDFYLKQGYIRPYIQYLFNFLWEQKWNGFIKYVVVYTNASNKHGWVSFLVDLIMLYTQCPDIIDYYLDRTDPYISEYQKKYGYVKSIQNIIQKVNTFKDIQHIFMLDDRPNDIRDLGNAVIRAVPPYYNIISWDIFNKFVLFFTQGKNENVKNAYIHHSNFPNSSDDTALISATTDLENFLKIISLSKVNV